MLFALWKGWKDPANDEWLHTCTIITEEPSAFVREIQTQMPVILPEEHHDAWFMGEVGKDVLVPFPADRMNAWPIDARVNSPKNNDPQIILLIELDPEHYLPLIHALTKGASECLLLGTIVEGGSATVVFANAAFEDFFSGFVCIDPNAIA